MIAHRGLKSAIETSKNHKKIYVHDGDVDCPPCMGDNITTLVGGPCTLKMGVEMKKKACKIVTRQLRKGKKG